MSSLLETLQNDAEGRLLADPFFDDIAIVVQRKGVTLAEIQRRLTVLNGRGQKAGACVLVLMPGGGSNDQTPGPRLAITQSFIVLVHPELNSKSTGTGKSPEEIALRLLQIFNFASFGYGAVLHCENDALVPNDTFDGLVGYQVNLHTFSGETPLPKVAPVTIEATDTKAPATVQLSCATDGAKIWFTTDGSYPSSANATASLYAAQTTLRAGCTLRTAAERFGLAPSNITQLVISSGGLLNEAGEQLDAEGGEILKSEAP